MWLVLFFVTIVLILIKFYNQNNVLVVLYSTKNKHWNETINSHIALFDKYKGQCIIGIHYWDEPGTPDEPPDEIKKYKYIMTKSKQTPLNLQNREREIFEYIRQSTKLAFENAEELYKKTFGFDMPENQKILRLRPDVLVEYFPISYENSTDDFYLSRYDINARRYPNPKSPEVGDIIALTTKKTLKNILTYDVDKMDKTIKYYTDNGYELTPKVTENLSAYAVRSNINDYSIKIKLVRDNKIDIK